MAWVGPISEITGRQVRGPRAWTLALALFAVALLVRVALGAWLDPIAFLTFYPAIVAATLLCGWRPGAAVAVAAALAGWYLYLEPRGSLALERPATAVTVASFLAVALFLVTLVAALSEVVRRLDAARALQAELFRELQHRTANNMQLVASALRVAGRRLNDPAARGTVEQAVARVEAMARLSRRLYDPDAYRQGLEPVLREVLAETFRDLRVAVSIDLVPAPLSVDRMTALVLLVNEAALNAAKHAFHPGRDGAFAVSLRPHAGGTLRLVVHDDGPGPGAGASAEPPATSPAGARGLGMPIMRSLARQLGGELDVLDGPGMALAVTFALA